MQRLYMRNLPQTDNIFKILSFIDIHTKVITSIFLNFAEPVNG